MARRRAELGSDATPCYDKVQGKERRHVVQNKVRAAVEEEKSRTRWEDRVD